MIHGPGKSAAEPVEAAAETVHPSCKTSTLNRALDPETTQDTETGLKNCSCNAGEKGRMNQLFGGEMIVHLCTGIIVCVENDKISNCNRPLGVVELVSA